MSDPLGDLDSFLNRPDASEQRRRDFVAFVDSSVLPVFENELRPKFEGSGKHVEIRRPSVQNEEPEASFTVIGHGEPPFTYCVRGRIAPTRAMVVHRYTIRGDEFPPVSRFPTDEEQELFVPEPNDARTISADQARARILETVSARYPEFIRSFKP